MKTRRASKKDLPAILELIKEYPEKLMQEHLPKAGSFFVAVEDGKIVGCCALEIYSKRLAEIRSLAVTEKYHEQGIATKLIEKCMAEARKKKVYEVLAISGSISFFENYGFQTFQKEKFALIKILGS